MRKNLFYQKIFSLFFAFAVAAGLFAAQTPAATLSQTLQRQIVNLLDDAPVGVVVISFNTPNGLADTHLSLLRNLGITKGVTFQKLGMVGAVLTAGQIRALSNNPAVKSIWSNDRQVYYMNQARMVAGVDKLRTEAAFTLRNGGLPVSGAGDFSVFVIDSGIDATHPDLPLGAKVIQNTQRVVSTDTGNTGITVGGVALNGFTPSLSLENIPNTDTVGHGTHCAGIVGGLGSRSGGNYGGVAPGVKIVGSGGGAVILVLDALAGWEYALSHQEQYKIRIITNSYGPIGGGEYNPEHPFMIAAKQAYERNISVFFAGGNDGAAKDTLSPYAQAPFVIGVAAGTKDGMLADFSSRGTPRAERLADDDPLNDNDAPTLTAPGNGRYFESSLTRYGFTTDIVSVRAAGNFGASSGLTNDTEIPVGMIPFYTQISGTSMATPFAAGVAALMLDADPTLTPDEIKQILTDTATRMPGYEDYEVGAGYINAHAAVDKVYNRAKAYKNLQEVSFNTVFGEERPAAQNFHIDFNPAVSGAASQNATAFTVEPGMNALEVTATVDTALAAGTGNLVGIRLTAPDGVTTYSTAIDFPVIGSDRRELSVANPPAGTWTLEVRGARSLNAVPQVSAPTQLAAPGPVDGAIKQVRYILPQISDIEGHARQAEIEAALKNRLIDTFADGKFYPEKLVTRADLAQSFALNAPVRQTLGANPKFADVSGDLARIAEAVTAKGPTLRDYNFAPTGLLTSSGSLFNPNDSVTRLDAAIAFVKALGRDAEARGLANTNVTYNGAVLSDNAQIPGALRGYVQIAVGSGMFEAYPAEVIQIGPGQYQTLPGPRFEPSAKLTRAALAGKLLKFNELFTTGG
ncbi:MAG TPA: S8 family serine peptidase [Pyrinomonadaceae bacterium]|jgi:serine protease AprX